MESAVISRSMQSWGILTPLSWKKRLEEKNNPSLLDCKYVFPCFVFNKEEIKLGSVFLYAIQIQTIPFTGSLL